MKKTFVQDFMEFLGVQESTDRLTLLRDIVTNVQLKIPFDSVLKILNHHQQLELAQVAPHPDDYLQFIKKHGYGGTCFHLVQAVYEFLRGLQFEVSRIYLDYGHYALMVNVENQRWFLEVSYMSPLFDIYPLDAQWQVDTHRDVISWNPSETGKSSLVFEGFGHLPGQLTRTWDGTYSTEKEFLSRWQQSFQSQSPFLRVPILSRWDSTSTLLFCRGRMFESYRLGQLEEVVDFRDNSEGLRNILETRLKVDASFYEEALRITDTLS